ncbi:MAG: AAA family ATPase [Roseburia inulinivorans]|nr:AAA family ATPase [Roseburia inulinivorans]
MYNEFLSKWADCHESTVKCIESTIFFHYVCILCFTRQPKDIYLNNLIIVRHYPLEENINYCFVGIKRTGKSYMMYQQIQNLLEKKVPLSQIVYVNFEDERLLEMASG